MDQSQMMQQLNAGQQPQQQAEKYPPAYFSERFLAYIIDAMPFLLMVYVILYYLITRQHVLYSYELELKWKLIMAGVYSIYVIIFSSGGRVSVGKWMLGIRVRSLDGERSIGIAQAFLRTVFYFINNLTLNIGFVMAFVTPLNRGLHEYVSASRVVRVREKGDFSYGLIFALAWGVFGLLGASTYYAVFIKPSPQDEAKIMDARQELEKLSYYEDQYKAAHGAYTDDLANLAAMSPDLNGFKKDLLSTLVADNDKMPFEIGVQPERYTFSAYAQDSKHTRVLKVGP
jgi:uncharacterized RDD family membrane protein YckC